MGLFNQRLTDQSKGHGNSQCLNTYCTSKSRGRLQLIHDVRTEQLHNIMSFCYIRFRHEIITRLLYNSHGIYNTYTILYRFLLYFKSKISMQRRNINEHVVKISSTVWWYFYCVPCYYLNDT